jgi:site-specific DNA recombinase
MTRAAGAARCAIYTRKSSEEGLEQQFNSLDAQREACEAYVRSQRHEGWKLLPDRYDDGGFSGGSMERPALQRLLQEIERRRIDVVVVYKVDRLTRALTDFARIIEAFDRQGVSFVSVTQQFSTTTSMGRLTLNMLLSFAQFEREVTGERIRDKIAASKSKGMWMGGFVPLGYEANDRTLSINEPEAETVRTIFRLYLELGCVRRLKIEADQLGLVTKRRREGIHPGGRSFARGHLYKILSNPLYIGEIAHKGKSYPGQHPAIIDRTTWDAVQLQLADNRQGKLARSNAAEPSLLGGVLFDRDGERLSPSHATKSGRRYRYYVSRRLIEAGRDDAPSGLRIPAHEVEALVLDRLRHLLSDQRRLVELVGLSNSAPRDLGCVLTCARERVAQLEQPGAARIRLVRMMVERIVISDADLQISLFSTGLRALLDITPEVGAPDIEPYTISVPATLKRSRRGTQVIVLGDGPQMQRPADPSLVKMMVRAHRWLAKLTSGEATALGDIARAERVTSSYVARTVHLAFLAPDIVEAMLDGRQPVELTAKRLGRMLPLPLDWAEQRRALGVV